MLKRKIIQYILITYLIMAVLFGAILLPLQHHRAGTSMKTVNVLLSTLVERDKEGLANEIFEGRVSAVKLRINQMLEVDGVSSIAVFNQAGTPLAVAPMGAVVPAVNLDALKDGPVSWERAGAGGPYLEYVSELRIIGERIGIIHISYSLHDVVQEQFQSYAIFGLLLLLLLLVMLVVLRFLITKSVLTPITALHSAIARMGTSHSDAPGMSEGGDEIAAVNKAFQRMSDDLSRTYLQLNERNSELAAALSKSEDLLEEVRGSQRYVHDILESMPSAIFSVYPEGRVRESNVQAQQLVNQDADSVRGKLLRDLLPPFSDLRDIVADATRQNRPLTMPRMSLLISGMERYFESVVYPLKTGAGAVVRMDDITERVRMEEAMIQTEKMVTVGGLAAGMAHEINNPLGSILQGEQNIRRRLLEDLPANEKRAREWGLDLNVMRGYLADRGIPPMLDGLREAGQRAANIVRNMLDFSRRSDDAHTDEEINRLADIAVDLASSDYDLKKKYDFRKIDIIRNYAANLPPVRCNATEIGQVLLNLLKNAAQAMAESKDEERYPTISIKTLRAKDGVSIVVSDNGPGMDTESKMRVFEPFYTTKDPGKGTGLGLSVSYFIVTSNHGGSFTVESSPGHGATFTITLPASGGGA